MNKIEASWISLPCLVDCSWVATLVATVPARYTWRSAGRGTDAMAVFRSSTRVLLLPWSNGETEELNSSSTALPSGEVPR